MTSRTMATASQRATRAAPRRLADHAAAVVRAALDAWRERRRVAATHRELERLDSATLRDLGLHRSEAASVAAEVHGIAVASRRLSLASRVDARR